MHKKLHCIAKRRFSLTFYCTYTTKTVICWNRFDGFWDLQLKVWIGIQKNVKIIELKICWSFKFFGICIQLLRPWFFIARLNIQHNIKAAISKEKKLCWILIYKQSSDFLLKGSRQLSKFIILQIEPVTHSSEIYS
jgi:hypothetical protein